MLRPSKAGLAISCPPSLRPTEVNHEHGSEAAVFGSACHRLQAILVDPKDELALTDINEAVSVVGVEHLIDDALYIVDQTKRAWEWVQQTFPQDRTKEPLSDFEREKFWDTAIPEVHLENELYSGTADVVARDNHRTVVLDWKNGRRWYDAEAQLLSYLDMLRDRYGKARSGEYIAMTVWTRLGRVTDKTYTDADIDNHRHRIKEAIRRSQLPPNELPYSPGDNCTFCPHNLNCPGLNAMARGAVSKLGTADVTALSTEEFVALRPQVKALEAVIKQYKSTEKALVSKLGELPVRDGVVLRAVERNTRSIIPGPAWEVIQLHITPDEFAPCVKINKGDLLDAVAARAPRGKKQAAKDDFMNELRDAGAVRVSTSARIEEVVLD